MRFACLVVVLLASNVAHAEERSGVLSVNGGFGFLAHEEWMEDGNTSGGLGAVRATYAWERPSPQFAVDGKSNFSGSLVPELVVGTLLEEDRAEGFVGLGLRAELRAAHNKIAPFNLKYKVGAYLVARAMVLGKSQDAAYEFGIGEYFPRFSGFTRMGFELTVISRPNYMDTNDWQAGALLSLFAGFAP
jgi:hypothetical protein